MSGIWHPVQVHNYNRERCVEDELAQPSNVAESIAVVFKDKTSFLEPAYDGLKLPPGADKEEITGK